MNFKKLAHEIVDEVAGKAIELPVDLNESFLKLNIEPDKKNN